MSIEGLVGTAAAFDIDIHNARPHKGQIKAGFHGLTKFRRFQTGQNLKVSHTDFKIDPFYSPFGAILISIYIFGHRTTCSWAV